jgi:hypothetical protein
MLEVKMTDVKNPNLAVVFEFIFFFWLFLRSFLFSGTQSKASSIKNISKR